LYGIDGTNRSRTHESPVKRMNNSVLATLNTSIVGRDRRDGIRKGFHTIDEAPWRSRSKPIMVESVWIYQLKISVIPKQAEHG